MAGYNLRLNGSNYGDALLGPGDQAEGRPGDQGLTLTLVISRPRPRARADQSEAGDGGD